MIWLKWLVAAVLIIEGLVFAFIRPLSYIQPVIIAAGTLVLAMDLASWLRDKLSKRRDTV